MFLKGNFCDLIQSGVNLWDSSQASQEHTQPIVNVKPDVIMWFC